MPVTDLTGTTWVFNDTFPPHFPEKGEYYCDGYYCKSGNRPVGLFVGDSYADLGLWYCSASVEWSGSFGVRLCFRPL